MNAFLLRPLPILDATASSTAAGYAASNVTNDYAGVIWKAPDNSTPTLRLDLGSDQTIDTVMLFGFAGRADAATMQVAIATQAQGPTFSGPNLGQVSTPGVGNYWAQSIPANAGTNALQSGKRVALWTAPLASPPPPSRYVQLWFPDLFAGPGVEIGRVVIGRRFQPERNFAFGGAFGIRDFGSLEFSNRAVLLRRRAPKRRTLGISFSAARRDEVEATIMPLVEQLGGTDCVALVTDPAANAMRERRCFFGPLTGELGAIWRNAAAWEWRVNLLSLF